MKKYFLAILLAATIPGVLFASTYGKPYGANDETPMERSDVKTIDQLNRSTEIEERAKQEEQEPVIEEPNPDIEEPKPEIEEPNQDPDQEPRPETAEDQENKVQ